MGEKMKMVRKTMPLVWHCTKFANVKSEKKMEATNIKLLNFVCDAMRSPFLIDTHSNFADAGTLRQIDDAKPIHDDVCFQRRDRAPMINKTSSVDVRLQRKEI